jgi:fucose permease
MVRLPSPRPIQSDAGAGAAVVDYRLIGLIALFLFAYVGAEVSFSGWIFTYATTMGLTGVQAAGYLTSVFWGAITVGRIIAIPFATRVRPSSILLVALSGCLLSVGLVLVWPHSQAAIWAGAIGLGLFMAAIFPTVLLWAARRIPLSGSVTRWFFVGASLGAMLFPWLIGQYFDHSGPQVAMFMVFALLLADLGLFWLLMRFGGEAQEIG